MGVGKDAFSVLSGEAADMIGVEVRHQNAVDLLRCVACTSQALDQATQSSPAEPRAGTRVDEDQLLSGVDQEACVARVQQPRILLQGSFYAIHRYFLRREPVRIECGAAIEQCGNFKIPYFHASQPRTLVMVC